MRISQLSVFVAWAIFATVLPGQVATTSSLDGMVTDPQGAAVAGAQVQVTNVNNGQTFKTATDPSGHWVLAAMSSGVFKVRITTAGFRSTTVENVKIDAGVPTTANAQLEIGAVSETVEVSAGAELVQTASATLNTTLEGQMVRDLPQITRGGLDLLVAQPGVQTAGANRNSSINGLPNGAINVTIDGLNTQDQELKSGNGFFTYIPITQDSIEEVTVTTSAAGAESTGEGAAQVKFITRSGTNEFHGGVFEQIRNTALDANYYFNNINGLPRDKVQLNQFGGHVGGPIWKNKLFFFTNIEFRRQPESAGEARTVLTPDAITGNYTYLDPVTNQTHTINVLQLAAANGYQGTADPIVSKTLGQINNLVQGQPGLIDNISSSSDYIRNTLNYLVKGNDSRTFTITRLDYNITSRNQLSFTYSYNKYTSTPDILNGDVPIYPGTGTVVGNSAQGGQSSNRFAGTFGLRSTITPRLTNEFHAGLNGGTVVFNATSDSPGAYAAFRGYNVNFGSSLSGVSSYVGGSRRNSPTKNLSDTLSWLKGSHMLSFGGDWEQVNLWDQSVGNESIPSINFGIDSADPIHSGTTDIFTNAAFPNATQGTLDDAANLYATLTGRVTSIGKGVAIGGPSKTYGANPPIDSVRQRSFGLFAQDSWRVRPNFTLTLGLRFEQQGPLQDLTKTYSAVTLASVWGISGIGNLYKPGVLTGVQPEFVPYFTPYSTPRRWNPSGGFAWQVPAIKGPLAKLFGSHTGATVIRGGYSIASIREGTFTMLTMFGSNPGRSLDDSVDPANYPQFFGNPGSVTISTPTLPTRPYPASPTYPFSPNPTDAINGFDSHLKLGYVQSWNFGIQRELGRNMVMEVRYTGNHGTDLWRQVALNEVNVFENGFLKDWYNAYNNLTIARQSDPASINFGNQGLPGQVDIPIIKTAYGKTSSPVFVSYLLRNEPGFYAYNAFAQNATRMGHLLAAGYPANFFIVNPAVPGGGTYLVNNSGSSYYDALQVEVRRRMTAGLMVGASYVWSKSLVDGPSQDANLYTPQPTTFRNLRLDRQPTPFDIPQALKLNMIYELPFGAGRRFLSGGNPAVRKVLEGWELAAVDRNQSGTPYQILSGREGMNQNDPGVVLHGITAAQLQSMMSIRQTTGSNGTGLVSYLPQSLIDNTNAAFESNGKSLADLNPNAPYIGPQLAQGQFGYEIFLRGPWQNHFDLSLMKKTRIKERVSLDFSANFLNVLNVTNFQLANTTANANNFGLTTTAYQDLSNAQDPGARVVEFRLRVNF